VLANGVAGSRAARNLAQGLGNQTDQVPADDEQLRAQERSSVSQPVGRLSTGVWELREALCGSPLFRAILSAATYPSPRPNPSPMATRRPPRSYPAPSTT